MQSNIVNLNGARVEQLSVRGTFIGMNNAGAFVGGSMGVSAETNRIYVLNRMSIIFDLFINPNTNLRSFPKFEQFALQIFITGYLADIKSSPGSNITTTLFQNLLWATSDGISNTRLLKEPFIVKTTSSRNNSLLFNFTDAGSVLLSLSGQPVPPPVATTINFNGVLMLEGYSLPNSIGTGLVESLNFAKQILKNK